MRAHLLISLFFLTQVEGLRFSEPLKKPAPLRTCFQDPADFAGPLEGSWQTEPTDLIRTSPYSEVMVLGKSEKSDNINVDHKRAEEWKNHACPLEETHTSCFYHGSTHAAELAKRTFVPTKCHLPPFNAQYFLQKNAGKTIRFIGDSVTRQAFESLGCHMSEFIVKIENLRWQAKAFTGRINCPFKDNEHCWLDSAPCVHYQQNVSVCFHEVDVDAWKIKHIVKDMGKTDVLIVNLGAHHGTAGQLEIEVNKIVPVLTEWRSAGIHPSNRKVIWREVSPQHFDSQNGNYPPKQKHDGYACVPRANSTIGNWRNEVANPIMKKNNIDILYVHENANTQ